MPQSLTQKAVNNFVRGLITESAELTFPEGASVDELNCDLRRDGTRRRRLGVKYEDSNVLSSYTLSSSEKTSTGSWSNVNGDPDVEYLVLQKGNTLYFYNKATQPFSNQLVGSLSLTGFEKVGSSGAETDKCQFASIKGGLVVVNSEINAIYVYINISNNIAAYEIDFEVRVFEFQGDSAL
jgi:hypothetical protein